MLTVSLQVFIGDISTPTNVYNVIIHHFVGAVKKNRTRKETNMAKFWFNTVETVRRTYRCTIDDSEIEEALTDVDRTNPDAVKDAIHDLVRENMWDDYTFEEEYDNDFDEATPEWDSICDCADDYIEDEDSKQTLGEIE